MGFAAGSTLSLMCDNWATPTFANPSEAPSATGENVSISVSANISLSATVLVKSELATVVNASATDVSTSAPLDGNFIATRNITRT